jgi:hypothetical protein
LCGSWIHPNFAIALSQTNHLKKNDYEEEKYYDDDACPRRNVGAGSDEDSNCHWLFTRSERRHAGAGWYRNYWKRR